MENSSEAECFSLSLKVKMNGETCPASNSGSQFQFRADTHTVQIVLQLLNSPLETFFLEKQFTQRFAIAINCVLKLSFTFL